MSTVHLGLDIRVFFKECRSLQAAGFDVVLIAQHPKDEIIDGVTIRALPTPSNRQGRVTQTAIYVYRLAMKEDADLYHFHDPELIPVGLMLKLRGKRVVYDVHEYLPLQIADKRWIHPILRPLAATICRIVEDFAVGRLDGVVATTPAIARRWPGDRTIVAQNFPLLSDLVPSSEAPYLSRGSEVIYVGAWIGISRGAREMVMAVGDLQKEMNVRLVLVGRWQQGCLEELEKLPDWSKVEYVGSIPHSEVKTYLNRARVGLVVERSLPNHREAQPVKLFEYMCAGIPVISSDFPVWRKFVDDAQCGICVDPLDVDGIKDAIKWILEHPIEAEEMGKRGQQSIINHYSWDREAEKLVSFYEYLFAR